jgi:hypothetical protein
MMGKHKARLKGIPKYIFIYEYADEVVEFSGVERFGIHQNGTHSLRTVIDGVASEHQIGTGWKRMILEPDPLAPEYKKGRRVITRKQESR